jgi:hypothetical protein
MLFLLYFLARTVWQHQNTSPLLFFHRIAPGRPRRARIPCASRYRPSLVSLRVPRYSRLRFQFRSPARPEVLLYFSSFTRLFRIALQQQPRHATPRHATQHSDDKRISRSYIVYEYMILLRLIVYSTASRMASKDSGPSEECRENVAASNNNKRSLGLDDTNGWDGRGYPPTSAAPTAADPKRYRRGEDFCHP